MHRAGVYCPCGLCLQMLSGTIITPLSNDANASLVRMSTNTFNSQINIDDISTNDEPKLILTKGTSNSVDNPKQWTQSMISNNSMKYTYKNGTTDSDVMNLSSTGILDVPTQMKTHSIQESSVGGTLINGVKIRGTTLYIQNNDERCCVYGGNPYQAQVGGHLLLYGGTHATLANQCFYNSNTHTFRKVDASTGTTVVVNGKIMTDRIEGTSALPVIIASNAGIGGTIVNDYQLSNDTNGISLCTSNGLIGINVFSNIITIIDNTKPLMYKGIVSYADSATAESELSQNGTYFTWFNSTSGILSISRQNYSGAKSSAVLC